MDIIIEQPKGDPTISFDINDLSFGEHTLTITKRRRQLSLFPLSRNVIQRIKLHVVKCRRCQSKKAVTFFSRHCQVCGDE